MKKLALTIVLVSSMFLTACMGYSGRITSKRIVDDVMSRPVVSKDDIIKGFSIPFSRNRLPAKNPNFLLYLKLIDSQIKDRKIKAGGKIGNPFLLEHKLGKTVEIWLYSVKSKVRAYRNLPGGNTPYSAYYSRGASLYIAFDNKGIMIDYYWKGDK